MQTTPNSASLEVLSCPSCAAPVPLGDGDDALCPYCRVAFPAPERYRGLRDAERRTDEERAEAESLYATLGRPPGAVARFWGDVATGCVWLFLWPLVFVAESILIVRLFDVVSRSTHVTLTDVLPQTQVWAIVGVALYLTLAVPIVLGVYGRRRTNARRTLQAALAALPPDREGGPVRCHACGAPLAVGARDLGIQCVYCGADNLVRMPETWVARSRASAKRLDASAASAAEEDRAMRRRERRRVAINLAWLSLFVVGCAAIGVAEDRAPKRFPPSWRAAMAREPREFLGKDFDKDDDVPYALGAIEADGRPTWTTFSSDQWHDDHYETSYLVALRYGETVRLASGDFPTGARALGFDFQTRHSALFGDGWTSEGKLVMLYPNATAEFVVPRSAWYRVNLLAIDRVPPRRRFDLSVTIDPPK